MIGFAEFAFLRPWWLLAIPAVILLAVWAWRKADGFGRWREVIDPDLLPVLVRLGQVEVGARDYRPVFMAFAVSLMAIGLAGPSLRNPGAPIFRNMDAIVILVDLSPSIVEGGGLGDAQSAVARLLDSNATRPVALIVYAGESFLVSVPTREPQALKSAIAVIDTKTMPVSGSRPDRALKLAMQVLNDAKSNHADVIVVSDGGGLGPEALHEIDAMARSDIRVSGVYINHEKPPFGVTPANRRQLEEAVEVGGGEFADARNLASLEEALATKRGLSATEKARRAVLFRDYGIWFFAFGALVLLPIYQQRRET